MNQRFRIKMLAALSFFLVSHVFAFNRVYVPQANVGMTVAADLGYAGLWGKLFKKHSALVNQSFADSEKSTSFNRLVWGGHVEGYLPVGRKATLGIQAGYLNFGEQSVTGTASTYQATTSMVPIMATVNMLFDNYFNFSLRGGVAYVWQKMAFNDGTTPSNNFKTTQKGVKPVLSVGLGYLLNNRIKFDISYLYLIGAQSQPTDVALGSSPYTYHGKILSQDALLVSLGCAFNL